MLQDGIGKRAWGVGEYDELLAGMGEPGHLRQADRRGMTPAVAAALDAGSGVSRLMGLLDSPGLMEGETALDRIEGLLAELVAEQLVTNERLNALVRLLSPRAARKADGQAEEAAAISRPPRRPARAPAVSGTMVGERSGGAHPMDEDGG